MEKTEHQNFKNLSQFTRHQFLMKITQLLLSVSVFYLLMFNSRRLSFLYSFNFYFSTIPVKLFNHNINKNCIFLLCNGLLVFVAKFSGLITSSSSKYNNHNKVDQSVNNYDQDYYAPTFVLLEQSKLPLEEKENVVSLEERKENEVKEKEQEREVIVEQENDEDQEEDKVFEDKFIVQEKHQEDDQEYYEDEDEQEKGILSTEELNKKIEEFIRKMKEEIRFEEQQQLVMVS